MGIFNGIATVKEQLPFINGKNSLPKYFHVCNVLSPSLL
jgi:hypothetical protein